MKKRSSGDYFNLVIALAVVIVFLAIGVSLIVSGIRDHKTASIVGGGFLVACGGLGPVLVLGSLLQRGMRRHVPGAAPPTVELKLDRTRFVPGQQVAGHVHVQRAGHARALDVTLRCRDSSGDYSGTSWSSATAPLARGELPARSEYPFVLTLPGDAPESCSFAGARIWWEVDARCDVLGTDVHATTAIEVATPANDAAHNF